MRPTVVTSFHKEGFEQYGEGLLDSYGRHCSFPLVVYTENMPADLAVNWPFVHQREQLDILEQAAFLERHKGDPAVAGRVPQKCWKTKDFERGYSFRTDAWKFSRMVYAMWHASLSITGPMIWIDGDTVVRQDVPEDFFQQVLPEDHVCAYLGRYPFHTETGFLAFDLPHARPILDRWAGFYTTDDFRMYPEWHSAYLFDRARDSLRHIRCFDLTPGGRGHVIHSSQVGLFFDHLKGVRKNVGRSPEAKAV